MMEHGLLACCALLLLLLLLLVCVQFNALVVTPVLERVKGTEAAEEGAGRAAGSGSREGEAGRGSRSSSSSNSSSSGGEGQPEAAAAAADASSSSGKEGEEADGEQAKELQVRSSWRPKGACSTISLFCGWLNNGRVTFCGRVTWRLTVQSPSLEVVTVHVTGECHLALLALPRLLC